MSGGRLPGGDEMLPGTEESVSELEDAYDRALAGHRFAKSQAIAALRLFRRGLIGVDVYERFRVQDRAAVARVRETRNSLRQANARSGRT